MDGLIEIVRPGEIILRKGRRLRVVGFLNADLSVWGLILDVCAN